MAAVRSITKVVFSLIFLTDSSALESFNVTPSINTYVSLLFDVSLLYPSSVARFKGIDDKGYVKAAAKSIIHSLAMEKANKYPRLFGLILQLLVRVSISQCIYPET